MSLLLGEDLVESILVELDGRRDVVTVLTALLEEVRHRETGLKGPGATQAAHAYAMGMGTEYIADMIEGLIERLGDQSE